jgi:hypothetical protein
MSLWSDFIGNHHSRAAMKPTHYFHAYEAHLERFRGRSVTMVEIGVWHGGSLQMWKKYLGPSAQIVGLDVDPKCGEFEEPQVAVRIGDQADTAFLQGVVDEFGPIDIVLDDGSHRPDDIAASFAVLYPRLDRNGVYIVEDTGTSYMPNYGGGLGRAGTFIETVKGRIDELHATYAPEIEATPFTETTRSVHVYPGLVVFERGRSVDRRVLCTVPDAARRERDPVSWSTPPP